jgi:hypothetical protein
VCRRSRPRPGRTASRANAPDGRTEAPSNSKAQNSVCELARMSSTEENCTRLRGITRTESQTLPAIHHRPAQAESHGRDAIVEGHGRHRIKIVRAHDSGEIRIKTLPVRRAHNLLENHRHLFFFQTIGRRAHVGLRMAAEGGGVDAPDGLAQRQQSLVEVACWLPSMKVSYTPVKGWYCESSSRLEERTASGWSPQPETIEGLRAGNWTAARPGTAAESQASSSQCKAKSADCSRLGIDRTHPSPDHGGRHRDAHAGKAAGDAALAQKVAHKSEAASLAAERTGADPQKT